MDSLISDNIFCSLKELEKAIAFARLSLRSSSVSSSIFLPRLNEYARIMKKQKNLAKKLNEHIVCGNLYQAVRDVQVIRFLSAMLWEDMNSMLFGLPSIEHKETQLDLH